MSFMGRRIGVLYSSSILENVLSEGCLCQTYSFRIAKDGPLVTVTDKLSPQHGNVASWRIQGKMYPEEILGLVKARGIIPIFLKSDNVQES